MCDQWTVQLNRVRKTSMECLPPSPTDTAAHFNLIFAVEFQLQTISYCVRTGMSDYIVNWLIYVPCNVAGSTPCEELVVIVLRIYYFGTHKKGRVLLVIKS